MSKVEYKEKARHIRKEILEMMHRANSSHIGSCFSTVELLVALYFNILKISPETCADETRDRFILSKGHACAALYATLALRGFFDKKFLRAYCVNDGILPGHATRGCASGVEISSGSLGHGLSIGIGMALSSILNQKKYRVFILLGDGECDEGSVWEAAMFAGNRKLDNIVAIIDYNKIQSFGAVKDINDLEPFSAKWESFGWCAKEVNGHDIDAIITALQKTPFCSGKPSVLIAHTVKGKGVSFMENELKWHYKSPNDEELKKGLQEMGFA